jgi:hypothetical protein
VELTSLKTLLTGAAPGQKTKVLIKPKLEIHNGHSVLSGEGTFICSVSRGDPSVASISTFSFLCNDRRAAGGALPHSQWVPGQTS